jgi:hypothetical protein
MKKKNPSYPKCKSENVAVIAYEYPEDMDAYLKGIENGTIAPGGCCIGEDDPIWLCNNCRNEFGNRFTTLEEM